MIIFIIIHLCLNKGVLVSKVVLVSKGVLLGYGVLINKGLLDEKGVWLRLRVDLFSAVHIAKGGSKGGSPGGWEPPPPKELRRI